jgi:acyl-CoA hydrolase
VGVADLRAASLTERAARLVAVAPAEHRADLTAAAGRTG